MPISFIRVAIQNLICLAEYYKIEIKVDNLFEGK